MPGTTIDPLMPLSAARLRIGGNICIMPNVAVMVPGMMRLNISARRTNQALAPTPFFRHAPMSDNALAICHSRQGLAHWRIGL